MSSLFRSSLTGYLKLSLAFVLFALLLTFPKEARADQLAIWNLNDSDAMVDHGNDIDNLVVKRQVFDIPEPASIVLFGLGLTGTLATRWRSWWRYRYQR